MREELRPYEDQEVVVRGTLKEAQNPIYAPEGIRYLLFVNCVWKPRSTSVKMAEVRAGKTDHAWVSVSQEILDEWILENPTSILLKKYENVFRVEGYCKATGEKDLGFVLVEPQPIALSKYLSKYLEPCKLVSRQLRDIPDKALESTYQSLLLNTKEMDSSMVYPSLDSELSVEEAFALAQAEVKECADKLKARITNLKNRAIMGGIALGIRRERI